jgi:hypothetical protein
MVNLTSTIDKRYLNNFNSSVPGIKTLISDLYFVRKVDK